MTAVGVEGTAGGLTPGVLDPRRMAPEGDGGWRLLGGRCAGCAALAHPYRARCAVCGEPAERVTLQPEGRVVAATTVRLTRPDVLLEPPFQAVLVELADGPLVRLPSREPEPLAAGERVCVRALALADGEAETWALEARRARGEERR